MRLPIMVLTIVLSVSIAQSQEIQLFNPDFFGQPSNSPIKLLLDKKADEIEPYIVSTDIKCGKYIAASVFYPKRVSFAQAKESLNKLYRGQEGFQSEQEPKMATWRIEEKKCGISLVQEDDHVRIMYIQFQPTKEVMKNMMKAMGTNTEPLEENDCKDINEQSEQTFFL